MLVPLIKGFDARLARIEQGLLVSAVLVMIGMAVLQIILRNGFGFGIIWAEPMVRLLVLWTALIGAMQAARSNEHIRIAVLLQLFPEHLQHQVLRLCNGFAGVICLVAAYYCGEFVWMEYEYQVSAFADLPNWICAIIMPLGFVVIGLRYLVRVVVADQEAQP